MKDARFATVAWALWLQKNHASCVYSEGPQRYANLRLRGVLPFVGDCSATLRDYYSWAGAPDPYKLGYNVPEGYTGTELDAGELIGAGQVLPGDAVVYGPGTGWHTALIVMVRGYDILTISMGAPGGPDFVWVSKPRGDSLGLPYDGREPVRYLRFATATRTVYWPQGFVGSASKATVKKAGLRRLTPPEQVKARENGWTVYGWDGQWFRPEGKAVALGYARFGSIHFATKRAE